MLEKKKVLDRDTPNASFGVWGVIIYRVIKQPRFVYGASICR